MKRRTFLQGSSAVLAAGLMSAKPARATSKTWRLGYINAPKTVHEEVVLNLPDTFKRISDGLLEVTSSSSLVPATEHLAAIKDGRIDMAMVNFAYYSGEAPLLNIGALPGLFPTIESYRVADRAVLHDEFAKILADRYDAELLVQSSWSGQVVWSRDKPIRTAEDFRGLKFRAHSVEAAMLMQSLGASPITMPVGEFLVALQRGVVDAGVTGVNTGFNLGLGQVAKYLCDWRIAYPSCWGLVVRRSSWNELSADMQAAIKAEMLAAQPDIVQRTIVETDEGVKGAIAAGATYVEPDAGEFDKVHAPERLGAIYESWYKLNAGQGITNAQDVVERVQLALK